MIRQRLARLLALLLTVAVLLDPGVVVAGDSAPIGLTLADLHAIRDANLACSAWLPKDLSADLRKLLLERSDNEVVQLIVYPDGRCSYRGLTERKLLPGPENKGDYLRLLNALGKPCFKVASIQATAFTDLAQITDNPAAFTRNAAVLFRTIDGTDITAKQRAYFDRRIGQSVRQLPTDVQKNILKLDQGNRFQNAIDAADKLERFKLDAIKKSNAPAASPADYRILAGQSVHAQAHADGQVVLPSKLATEGAGIYQSRFGPGRSVLLKMSPEYAKSLPSGTGLADFAEMAEKGKVEIYFDRMGQEKPTKVNGSELKAAIKNLQSK